jgi:hypothetical protein
MRNRSGIASIHESRVFCVRPMDHGTGTPSTRRTVKSFISLFHFQTRPLVQFVVALTMPCMTATIDDQSDGACHMYPQRCSLHGGRIHDSTTGEESSATPQLHHSSSPAQTLNGKINMPPVTRTQTRSLPAKSEDTGPAAKTPPYRPLRHRKTATHPSNAKNTSTTDSTNSRGNHSQSPPRFTIDLSLPPSQRYAEVCHALGDEMRGLQSLFDEVVGEFLPSWLHVPSVVLNWVAWALLWRVCDDEEDAELDVSFSSPRQLLFIRCVGCTA